MSKICSKCNMRLSDTAKFCPMCGTAIKADYAFNYGQPAVKPLKKVKKGKKKTPIKVIIAIILIIAVLAGGGVGYFFVYPKFFNKSYLKNKLKKATDKHIIEFFYDDFNGDNIFESFAVVGKNDGENISHAEVWFISNSADECVKDDIDGKINGILEEDSKKYISVECEDKENNSSASYIYGVENKDEYTEPGISGKYQNVHMEDGKIVSADGTNISINEKSDSKSLVKSFGNVIQIGNNIYYWKYNANSFRNSAINQNYTPIGGAVNHLVCRDMSGKEKVILEIDGTGEIAASKERIFFNKVNGDYALDYELFSCKYDGSDVKSHGKGQVIASSEDGNYIIAKNDYAIVVYTGTGNLKTKINDARLIIMSEDRIFYQEYIESSEARNGKTILNSVNFDGTDKKNIYTTETGLYGDGMVIASSTSAIYSPYIQGDYIYYSYGSIAGTGQMFQGGKIVKAKLDGTGGSTVKEVSNSYFIVDKSGNVSEAPYEYKYQFTPHGSEFWSIIDGIIGYYDYSSDSVKNVVEKDDYYSTTQSQLDYYEEDGVVLEEEYIEKTGDKIFYSMKKGHHNSANDMGWRYSYDRVKSYLFEKDLKTGKTTLIYEY